jgi:hypothetical protein
MFRASPRVIRGVRHAHGFTKIEVKHVLVQRDVSARSCLSCGAPERESGGARPDASTLRATPASSARCRPRSPSSQGSIACAVTLGHPKVALGVHDADSGAATALASPCQLAPCGSSTIRVQSSCGCRTDIKSSQTVHSFSSDVNQTPRRRPTKSTCETPVNARRPCSAAGASERSLSSASPNGRPAP